MRRRNDDGILADQICCEAEGFDDALVDVGHGPAVIWVAKEHLQIESAPTLKRRGHKTYNRCDLGSSLGLDLGHPIMNELCALTVAGQHKLGVWTLRGRPLRELRKVRGTL